MNPVHGATSADPSTMPAAQPQRTRPRFRPKRNYFSIKASAESVDYPRVRMPGYLTQAHLIRAAHSGDTQAKQLVWNVHARLSYSIVNRYRVAPQDVADCLQATQIGLQRAIDRFDVLRLNEFSTYAYHWLRQAAQQFRQRCTYFIAIPSHLYGHYARYRRTIVDTLTPAAWFEARSAWIEADHQRYHTLLRIHALAEPAGLHEAAGVFATEEGPLDQVIAAERVALLERALGLLPQRERSVLILRYGIGDQPEHTLEEIGTRWGITRERVRQIQQRAEQSLRGALAQVGLKPDHQEPQQEPPATDWHPEEESPAPANVDGVACTDC